MNIMNFQFSENFALLPIPFSDNTSKKPKSGFPCALKWTHLNSFSDVHLCEYVCTGGKSCCTKEHPCSQWEGDCDNDDECKHDLVCGSNNCPRKTGMEWDEYDDCCFRGNVYIYFH